MVNLASKTPKNRNAYKTREIQQDHTWPCNRYWPQLGQKWLQSRGQKRKFCKETSFRDSLNKLCFWSGDNCSNCRRRQLWLSYTCIELRSRCWRRFQVNTLCSFKDTDSKRLVEWCLHSLPHQDIPLYRSLSLSLSLPPSLPPSSLPPSSLSLYIYIYLEKCKYVAICADALVNRTPFCICCCFKSIAMGARAYSTQAGGTDA